MTDTGDVSRVLGMNVGRDREKGTITIDQQAYTEDIVERIGMMDGNPAFSLEAGPVLSLNQPPKNLLDEESKRRYTSIVGATLYLELVPAALTMKEAVFCKNMMQELGFKDGLDRHRQHVSDSCCRQSHLHVRAIENT